MTSENRNRLLCVVGVVVLSFLFLLPTIFPNHIGPKGSLIQSWPSKPISLGLDLSGGVHLVYKVEASEAVKSRLQSLGNSIRADLIGQKIAVVNARAQNNGDLQFSFLSDAMAERGKAEIEKNNRELLFKEKSLDGSRVKLTFTTAVKFQKDVEINAVNQAVETLRNRVDQFGVAEPLIQRIGEDRVMLQMPGVSDVRAVKRVVGTVAKLEFRFIPLPNSTEPTIQLERKEGGKVLVEEEVKMSGDAVDQAQVVMDPTEGVQVILTLNSEGAKTFRRVTTDGVGRQLAIILDNRVYSDPRINEPIPGGSATISGGFSPEEARELAVILRAGALPAPLTIIEERTVGPTLGAESIKSGIMATLIGLLAISVFMSVYYGKSGMMAVATLSLNLIMIVAALAAFGATLTLPGIAGLALTLGIAVDSNVIIFERIRDELYNGSGRDASINSGFDKAYSALLDANLTSLLTAVVLYIFGTGPIRGFAVTLSIGIITTLFCAIFVARLSFDLFSFKGRKVLSI